MGNHVSAIKTFYSLALLIFSILMVSALIFDRGTSLSQAVYPTLAFCLFWGCLTLLSMVEGGQVSMVGLPTVDRDLYKTSHPISHSNTEWCHRGDNLDRYLLGRQFLVLVLVYVINLSGAPTANQPGRPIVVLELPSILTKIFLDSGLAMMLITCMVGQLHTQLNASHHMLDYINTHFMTFTLFLALAIEASGLFHVYYCIQTIVAKLAGKPIESNEPPQTSWQKLFFWCRVVISTIVLLFSLVVTLFALWTGRTTMWERIPPIVSLILLLVVWAMVGMLEGMQVAFYAVSKLSIEERVARPWAKRTCELLFHSNGRNLAGFMVGRQFCVVACFFFTARATTLQIVDGQENLFGVNDTIQKFFHTGLLGALATTLVASITWQLIASAFPLAFLSSPVSYGLLRLCLALEATGVCNGVWVLAAIHKRMAGFQNDDVYLGTAKDGASIKSLSVPIAEYHQSQTGHLTGGAFPAGHDLPGTDPWQAPKMDHRRTKILANIKTLHDLMQIDQSEENLATYHRALIHEISALDRLNLANQAAAHRNTDSEELSSSGVRSLLNLYRSDQVDDDSPPPIFEIEFSQSQCSLSDEQV